MKRNYYNIIKDGEIVHKGITSSEVTKITGITNVFQYATKGSVRDGQTIELSHQVDEEVNEGDTVQNQLLDVWDDKKKAYIHKEIKRSDLLKKLNMTSYRLSQNMSRGHFIQDRYLVTRSVSKEKLTPSKWTQEQIDAWNEIRKAAELLKTGKGKIVRKKVNGKWTGYVEEIK